MAMITQKTDGCINFVQRTGAHKNWIKIKSAGGCFSTVIKYF